MGISPLPLLSNDSNGEAMSESNASLWSKLLEAQGKPRVKVQKQIITRKKARHVRCRRPRTRSIEKKLKSLKKLIPNNESIGLDGLFRDTAEYVMCLQMRVKVMQIMVKVLTGSKDGE